MNEPLSGVEVVTSIPPVVDDRSFKEKVKDIDAAWELLRKIEEARRMYKA